jgi:hypothetical protein
MLSYSEAGWTLVLKPSGPSRAFRNSGPAASSYENPRFLFGQS